MRINELARDLEVKAKAVIDYLVEIGIEDKRSHSSSIEGELAEKVKAHFRAAVASSAAEIPPPAAKAEPAPAPAAARAEPRAVAPVERPGEKVIEKVKVAAPREVAAELKSPALGRRAPIAVAPPEAAPGPRRPTPLRPPIRSHAEPKPMAPAAAATHPLAEPKSIPPSAPAAAPGGRTAMPASPAISRPSAPPVPQRFPARGPSRPAQPLGPAKPGEPIYRRPPRPVGGPPRSAPPTAPGIFPPFTPGRRGPHPVRGRASGPAGRAGREREAELMKERSLRMGRPARAAAPPIVVDREVTITEGITVKDLSEKLGVKARDLIRRLLDQGVNATMNHTLDPSLAEQVAQSFGARTRVVTFEEETQEQVEVAATDGKVVIRGPVVTVMGHVDHGKTSLLDAIRETNVTAQEAGGITQHIGAYTVTINNRKIVFLDTPGHEAFTRMRARGAKVTDVVVLVVAADDGVMPQTLEAISHARAAKVPIIVAINKIDKPGALPERVKKQLGDHGLLAEDWGGDTVMVEVSAKQKTNLQLLLEMILLVTEIQELKSNPDRPGSGTVLEAKLDKGRGPVCSLLVQNGTLRVGDSFLVGAVFGKVRAMLDDRGHSIDEAGPSTPVEILGLQSLPQAGDPFQAVTDAIKAKQIALYRENKMRELALAKSSRLTLEQFQDQMKTGIMKELPIILKADVQGSAEVIAETLAKLGDERVKVKLVHSGVGAITVSDVLLASASNSVIVGFNVRPERKATDLAQQEQVDIRLHTIIYELMDEMRKALTGLLEPTHREIAVGRADVRQTFRVAKVGTIGGSLVSEGRLTKDCSVRLLRDNVVIYTGRISSLRRFKDDVQEVRSGLECGVSLENFADIKAGDVIEAFVTERVAAPALA